MWKVEVMLDENKVKSNDVNELEKMYATIDKAFINGAYMEKAEIQPDGTHIYISRNLKNQDSLAVIGAKIIAFMDAKWFTDNVRKFILGNGEPDDYSREDILKAWKVGVSC